MRMFKIAKFCSLLLLIFPGIALGHVCHPLNSGMRDTQICYKVDQNHLHLQVNSNQWNLKLSGYTVRDLKISPLEPKDKTFVFSYMDLSGISAGGSANVLLWRDGTLSSACNLELYANLLQEFEIDGNAYIALMQHYTKNYYYVSTIFKINKSGIAETNDLKPWNEIIHNYMDKLNNSKNINAKSIYSAFIASAYIQVNNRNMVEQYTKSAQSFSKEADSFISTFPTLSKNSRKPLRMDKWCQITPSQNTDEH
jgi:hypothetical protein